MGKLKDDFSNKDASTLIGQIIGIILLVMLLISVLVMEPMIKPQLLALSILMAGIALGWAFGILLSPINEFNDEKEKFTKVQQVVFTFITGALAAKLLPLLTKENIKALFTNLPLVTRLLYFASAFVITAIVVYYDRVYLSDSSKAKLSCNRTDFRPSDQFTIPIQGISDALNIKFYNKGDNELKITRGDEKGNGNDPKLIIAGGFVKLPLSGLGKSGDYLTVFNTSADKYGKFKLTIS